jgi:HEPN domain-containing protein
LSDFSDPTASDWARIARENVRDAQELANSRGWRNAYMLAGLAVECALKARIMRHLGLNRWPSLKERRELYSHDLGKLAELAGLRPILEEAVARSEPLGAAWMVAKDFAINRRYPSGRPFPVRLGRDMVEAVAGQNGLVEWLIRLPTSTK